MADLPCFSFAVLVARLTVYLQYGYRQWQEKLTISNRRSTPSGHSRRGCHIWREDARSLSSGRAFARTRWRSCAGVTSENVRKQKGRPKHEAARLFPQQRVLPGQNSVEPERVRRGTADASSAQGRAALSRLSRA